MKLSLIHTAMISISFNLPFFAVFERFPGIACAQLTSSGSEKTSSTKDLPKRIADPRLVNAYWVHSKVISGGLPDEASMQALAELKVKTIISVDGAKPDIALAKRFGMRYVHLPHGYDGISESRSLELARAVRDLEGPILIHCHHGKHRSPAAAATACILAGLVAPEEGLDILQAAGTNPHYKGLFQVVKDARKVDAKKLDNASNEFPEIADVPTLAKIMVEIDRRFEKLKSARENHWKTSEPDELHHDAILMREGFTELLRSDLLISFPKQFEDQLRESGLAAMEMEKALEPSNSIEDISQKITHSFEIVSKNCKSCHEKHRDIPTRRPQN